nr:immunoglobulin heavy chain junction region [Macaca mulatta]
CATVVGTPSGLDSW